MGQELHGECEARFSSVADAMRDNFAHRGELGAAVCLWAGGRRVVDLWAGHRDARQQLPWTRDTVVNLWSSTKGLAAITLAALVDDGCLDYEMPVADYWPAFGAAGKEEVTVAELLSHQAGLCGPRQPRTYEETVLSPELHAAELADMAPLWALGEGSGYHAVSLGFLVAALVRCVAGEPLSSYWRRRVAIPARIERDAFIGGFEDGGRAPPVAKLVQQQPAMPAPPDQVTPEQQAALYNLPISAEVANSHGWRRLGLASAGGTGNARGLAGAYAALTDPYRPLVSRPVLDAARGVRVRGVDRVLGMEVSFACGFQINEQRQDFGPNPRAFGHAGWGGSFGMADMDAGLAMGYVMNAMGTDQRGDPRAQSLLEAVYECL